MKIPLGKSDAHYYTEIASKRSNLPFILLTLMAAFQIQKFQMV